MRRGIYALALLGLISLLSTSKGTGIRTPKQQRSVKDLIFEPAASDSGLQFVSYSGNTRVGLFAQGAELRLTSGKNEGTERVRMTFVGSDPDAGPAAELEQRSYSNYFSGGPAQWRTNVAHYSRVRYSGIYPGIDAIFYGSAGKFEYDFVVSPGTNPDVIELSFAGEETLGVDRDGELVVIGSLGTMRQARPVAYQMFEGRRKLVSADYVLTGDRTVGLRVGAYDRSHELIIDPVLSFSTYFGGSGEDALTDIASDASGNTYIVGWTYSHDLPVRNSFQSTKPTDPSYGVTSFLAKFNPDGTLAFSTYFGGPVNGVGAQQVAVDSTGNILVAGIADSRDFPHVAGPMGNPSAGAGFIVKFDPSGTQILQNAFLSSTNKFAELGLDAQNNPYLLAYGVPGYPTVPYQHGAVPYGTFVTKLDASLSTIVYSVNPWMDQMITQSSPMDDIAVDADGNVYFVGITKSDTLPVLSPIQPKRAGGQDLYLAKLGRTGSLMFSTYFGGSSNEFTGRISVDCAGNIYLAGTTQSPDFPPVNAYRPTPPDPSHVNAFFTKIDRTGSQVLYSSYFPSTTTYMAEIAVDAYGDLFLTGSTQAADFPLVNPMDTKRGFVDPFVTKLDATASRLLYSTILGGSRSDNAMAIALDGNGDAHVGGNINSPDFPTVNAFQSGSTDGQTIDDAFIAKINDSAGGTPVICGVPPQPAPSGDPGAFTRVEDRYQDNSVIYTGDWHTNISTGQTGVAHSGGSASLAVDASARATFYFSGTAVRWIGYRDPYSGIAHVFVDGLMRERIDTYSATTQPRSTIFSIQNLPAGPHVISIEVRGEKNPSSGGAWVWLDAFDFAQSAGTGGTRENSCRVP
jgi:beta-propeller repeat-containing protein